MRICLVQLDTVVGDLTGNLAKIREHLAWAREGGADLVLFPELTLVGYPPRDLVERRALAEQSLAAAGSLAAELSHPDAPTVCIGGVDWPSGSLRARNVAHVIQQGRVHTVAKRLLPTYDVFDEHRHFAPGDGDQHAVFEIAGVRVGVLVCEDMWTDARLWGGLRMYGAEPTRDLVAAGAELIVNLSASPFHAGKLGLRAGLCQSHAVEHRVGVAYCNLVGGNDSLIFDGSSLLVDADGTVAAVGARFREDRLRATWSPTDRRFVVDDAEAIVRATHVRPSWEAPAPCTIRTDDEYLDEIEDALVLGMSGYLGKLGFRQAALGLSGGIDSALVAYLAARVLGGAQVLAVEMPSRYTANLSRSISRDLIDRLGLRAEVISIEPIQTAFLQQLAPQLAGRAADVTEENLQARIRGSLLMALSNKLGPIVLSTGNKSEMAVGYCTLYGDMNGGLSVISDVFKLQVYALCRRINARAGESVIPVAVIDRPPSAELRADQTDQDSLPPYEVLDPILGGMLEDQLENAQILTRLQPQIPNLTMATVARVRHLTNIAEFKRHQAAPTLRVSRKAWHGRRYPIVHRFRDRPAQ